MDAVGWGLFFLAIGIAVSGGRIGSGLSDLGDELRQGMEEIARAIECCGEDHDEAA